HAGWDSLTYLIYVGETASEAAMSAASIHYLIAESEGRLVDLERETSLMHALENARFVAIEAVDRAGNRSERSAPIELVHRLGIVSRARTCGPWRSSASIHPGIGALSLEQARSSSVLT